MNRNVLLTNLGSYSTSFEDERLFVPRFIELLQHPHCFKRSNAAAHITGSAWIVNHDFSKVLLLHHRKLNRWLQPGGHADGNENVFEVALKEAREETGISDFVEVYSTIFDIDIHKIPERKDVPEHFHFDIRFMLVAGENATAYRNHESHDLQWVALEDVADFTKNNVSIGRMIAKTKAMFSDK